MKTRILLLFLVLALASCRHEIQTAKPRLESIALSSDQHSFVCEPSGRPFHPWGNNYGNHGRLIEDFWATNWPAVAQDFTEMHNMGANVVRVHLQFGKFMLSPSKPNPDSLARLGRLLRLAEQTGLYLDLTGLASYRQSDVPAWYDQLSEADRWRAQAQFWESVAGQCAGSPAVLCYDLINEPVIATEKRKPGDYYAGALGGLNFVQFINLDPAGRTLEQMAISWTDEMTQAIRKHDQRHLITVGLLPFNPGANILSHFDFISVHLYPETGKINQSLDTLKSFAGDRPVVIEETFPLSCSGTDLEQFLLDSRPYATGWMGHYNGESISELEALKQSGKINLQQSLWLDWERLFRELGPQMH